MTCFQHSQNLNDKKNIVVCTWSSRKTAFMTRLMLSVAQWSRVSQVEHDGREMLSWTRPCLSKKTDAIVHRVSSHRRYRDEALSRGASRIFHNFELTSKFEVEVQSSRFEIALIKKNKLQKQDKKKKSQLGWMCGDVWKERTTDEMTNFQFRRSKLEVEARRLKFEIRFLDFLKSKKIPITKSQFDPFPFLHTPLQQVRGRAVMGDRGGGKGRRERRDSEVRLQTSDFELRSVKLATSNFTHSVLNEITAITNHASDFYQIEPVASRRKTFPS